MMDFVRRFIDKESSILDFTFDFNHHLIWCFDKMYSENAEAAEIFAEHFGEIVDNSDDELRDSICNPYDLVYDIITGNAW